MRNEKSGINEIDRQCFALLKSALFNENVPAMDEADWNSIYLEMKMQTVDGLVGDILLKLNLDQKLKQTWKSSTIAHVQHYYHIMNVQTQAIRLLSNAGILVVVLKGTTAAMYYPRPEYRAMGDIDILVKPEQYEEAVRLMINNGYVLIHQRESLERHASLSKDNVLFEVHRRFASFNDIEKANILETAVWESMDAAESVEIDGYCFNVLPAIENGLVLLQHINQHLEEGVGLRQIIDWMMYVSRVLDNHQWNQEFGLLAKKCGLYTLAIIMTRMCQMYLGLTTTDREWCIAADKGLCEALMQDILNSGNMGVKKRDTASRVSDVISRNYGIWGFLVHMQRTGITNWKYAQDHPYVKPFAWCYEMLQKFRRIRNSSIPYYKIAKMFKNGNERSKLLDRLDVKRSAKRLAVKTEDGYVLKIEK